MFRDGLGRDRQAQLGACSFFELRDAMQSARDAGISDFVIVSHNFEMLKQDSCDADRIVARRFERLCAYLAEHVTDLPVVPYGGGSPPQRTDENETGPHATILSTLTRYAEQAARRLL